jgi:hypothetical protein
MCPRYRVPFSEDFPLTPVVGRARGRSPAPQPGVRRPCHNRGSGDRATTGLKKTFRRTVEPKPNHTDMLGLRGGSYDYQASHVRSAQRNPSRLVNRYGDFGFRLARTLTP